MKANKIYTVYLLQSKGNALVCFDSLKTYFPTWLLVFKKVSIPTSQSLIPFVLCSTQENDTNFLQSYDFVRDHVELTTKKVTCVQYE